MTPRLCSQNVNSSEIMTSAKLMSKNVYIDPYVDEMLSTI